MKKLAFALYCLAGWAIMEKPIRYATQNLRDKNPDDPKTVAIITPIATVGTILLWPAIYVYAVIVATRRKVL